MIIILIVLFLIFPSSIYAQNPAIKCPKGLQLYENSCISQRMLDYITCFVAAGGNRQQVIQEILGIAGEKTSGKINASAGKGPVGVAGGFALDRASERTVITRLETKWFPNGMSECAKVLDKKEIRALKKQVAEQKKAAQKGNELIQAALERMEKNQANAIQAIIAMIDKEEKNLNKQLATLYKREVRASDLDAQKWAQDTMSKAGAFKKDMDRLEEIRKESNIKLSKSLNIKIYTLFDYIINLIDSRFMAIQKFNPSVKYEKSEKFYLFGDESMADEKYNFRTVALPNGNKVLITIFPGKLSQGLVVACPSLVFSEIAGNNVMQSFKIYPYNQGFGASFTLSGGGSHIEYQNRRILNDVGYAMNINDPLNEKFKNELDSNFSEFFQIAIAR